MSSLLSQTADWLYQVNPTLCKIPPRANDEEYCFMGPDGGTDGAILCGDISYSMATCVGSWMLSPTHHIVEGIAVTLLALVVLHYTAPRLFADDTTTTLRVQHPTGAHGVTLFCLTMVMIYKWYGYPRRLYYMVMPCNMQWVLSFLQCWMIPESWTRTQYIILQLKTTFLMSVVIGIVLPETSDCELPGEYIFYWLNHFLLLWLPAAYVQNGSISCFSSTTSTWSLNGLWWAFSCAAFAVFYFIPVTFLAIYSGLNLNFMLHPPHDHVILRGQWYRLVTVVGLCITFWVSRLLVMAYEKVATTTRNNKTTKQL
ncbi:expressed unknown protein [Seminavis robusta]|uniref:Uncharacterized protein n=1 Tax=Seminavis robusta TaxID=568900 RepID=A0A9N8HMA9_9STRA|nr:expressed unknown protein [Seminavis robusta]|eukprot:Sro983_g227830.1 n/a (313) ;mRNA; f:26641-27579